MISVVSVVNITTHYYNPYTAYLYQQYSSTKVIINHTLQMNTNKSANYTTRINIKAELLLTYTTNVHARLYNDYKML